MWVTVSFAKHLAKSAVSSAVSSANFCVQISQDFEHNISFHVSMSIWIGLPNCTWIYFIVHAKHCLSHRHQKKLMKLSESQLSCMTSC